MDICNNCGFQIEAPSRFCSGCGTPAARYGAPQQQYALPQQQPPGYPLQAAAQQQYVPPPPPRYTPQQPAVVGPHHAVARGFAQTFGLHPAMALLTVVVNTMVFTSGLVTGTLGWFTSIPVGIVIGIIVYLGQKKWYGDDNDSAIIKALIVAFLTAIPTSLPGYLTIPSGIVGFFRRNKR
jgi:hypothetical protein